jgi:phage baseplate assembly protein gpV
MSSSEDLLVAVAAVKIDGQKLSDETWNYVVSVDVELSAGAVGWCRTVINLDNGMPSEKWDVGGKIEVEFDNSDTVATVFKGDIVAIGTEVDHRGQVMLIEAFDESYKLGADVKVRTFVKQTDGAILQTIAGECGLSLSGDTLATENPHLFQGCTNQEFVERICRRNGAEWTVAEGKLVINFKKPTGSAAVTLAYGENLWQFSGRFSTADHAEDVTVQGWDPKAKKPITGKNETIADRSTTGFAKAAAKLKNPRHVTSIRSLVASDADAKSVASGIARRMAATALSGSGETSGIPTITPGIKIKIEQMVDERWNGEYYVTSARHTYDALGYRTEFQFGPIEPASLVDVLGTTRTDTGAAGELGISRGVTIGLVTNNDNDPDGLGRVKVKFPYLSDKLESDWARVAGIGGGPERGILFMPEVDDEVLVAFEHGDLRRPYVLGGLWNGKDKQPKGELVKGGAVIERVIVATTGGDGDGKAHKIRMRTGDKPDDRFVAIELGDGETKAHIGESKIEVIANKGKTIELKNDKGSILIDAGGNVTIKGEKIELKSAAGDIILDGVNVNVKSKAAVSIKAGSTAEVKASAKMDVDGGGMLNLKGGMVKVN